MAKGGAAGLVSKISIYQCPNVTGASPQAAQFLHQNGRLALAVRIRDTAAPKRTPL
jgi:hypothetical protein